MKFGGLGFWKGIQSATRYTRLGRGRPHATRPYGRIALALAIWFVLSVLLIGLGWLLRRGLLD